MKKLIALAASALVSCAASASFVVDFSNVPLGSSVGEFYNGGFDTGGTHRGQNYGISFSGGTIGNTAETGAYLAGGTTITLNQLPTDLQSGFSLYFLSNINAEYALVDVVNRTGQIIDRSYTAGNWNPYCFNKTAEQCRAEGYYYNLDRWLVSRVSVGPDAYQIIFRSGPTLSIDQLSFGGDVSFYNNIVNGNPLGKTEVPEPASLALVGLGLAGLVAARRKASKAK